MAVLYMEAQRAFPELGYCVGLLLKPESKVAKLIRSGG